MGYIICNLIEIELFRVARDKHVTYSFGFRTLWTNLYRNEVLRERVLRRDMSVRELVDRAVNNPFSLATDDVLVERDVYERRMKASSTINDDGCIRLVNDACDSDHFLHQKE